MIPSGLIFRYIIREVTDKRPMLASTLLLGLILVTLGCGKAIDRTLAYGSTEPLAAGICVAFRPSDGAAWWWTPGPDCTRRNGSVQSVQPDVTSVGDADRVAFDIQSTIDDQPIAVQFVFRAAGSSPVIEEQTGTLHTAIVFDELELEL